jgi:flavorubredoxin
MMKRFGYVGEDCDPYLVKEGDVLRTGRHELTFVMAPMVHWPEVMMTFDLSTGTLFSADAFGTFGALNGADGVANPMAATAGIGEALITTAAGLVASLILLFPYNVIEEKTED